MAIAIVVTKISSHFPIFAVFMTKTKVTYSRIWQVAYPIILGSVAQNLIIFTDTAFLGRVGEIALGASAIGGLYYLAIIMLGYGFGIGAQIIIARRLGEGKLKEIGEVVVHSLVFLLLLSVVAFALIEYGSVLILKHVIPLKKTFNNLLQ